MQNNLMYVAFKQMYAVTVLSFVINKKNHGAKPLSAHLLNSAPVVLTVRHYAYIHNRHFDIFQGPSCFLFIQIILKLGCTQRRVQPDQCYLTVQITGSNFECSL